MIMNCMYYATAAAEWTDGSEQILSIGFVDSSDVVDDKSSVRWLPTNNDNDDDDDMMYDIKTNGLTIKRADFGFSSSLPFFFISR